MLSSTIRAEGTNELKEIIPSEDERVIMILLMLICRDEELSLLHFTSELKFSKNTILNDLKKAQLHADQFQIQIEYSRRYGYELSGKEFSIRNLFISLIESCLNIHHGKSYVIQATNLSSSELVSFQHKIDCVEAELGLKFTDTKIEAMPYILAFILRRIKKSKTIDSFNIHYDELSDTKEYRATERILDDAGNVPISDRLFITLHLLSTNVYWSESISDDVIPELREALNEMLELFEKRSCIFLKNKEQLLNKLMLHTKPAYYRIKYKLTHVNEGHQTTSPEFDELHHIAKIALKPLENLIGESIPDHEAMYLTMFLGGWLTKQGDSLQEKIKAVVVCPNGVAISRLMLSQLDDLFPEFVFLEALSVREFQSYSLHYDLVFSPIYVETGKKLFIISSLMDEEEKLRLRKQVMTETSGVIPLDVHLEQMMNIIDDNATIHNKETLKQELGRLIKQDSSAPENKVLEPATVTLSDLLHESTIQLVTKVHAWEDAIVLAAQPLLTDKSITPNYVEALLKLDTEDPHIVIGSNTAIPHADPEAGVRRVSMSLLQIKEGVTFAQTHTIHSVIIIAAPDKYQHLKALRQLIKLSQNPHIMNDLKSSKNANEIAHVIKQSISEDSPLPT
ncbi:BglG family transcription antiterminator [Alkalicoccobacillus porphyridii]|nr:BglG family transcription antiterminator [Alkalicoccobacillus porphyridii]